MQCVSRCTECMFRVVHCVPVLDNRPILPVFQLMLLEHIIMCRLVMGNKSLALSEISQACGLCQQHPRLLLTHRPQLHTLLGLYAMSMNCMEAAEAQFTAALRVRHCVSSEYSLHFHCTDHSLRPVKGCGPLAVPCLAFGCVTHMAHVITVINSSD
jgi:MAternally-affected-uncoordination protein